MNYKAQVVFSNDDLTHHGVKGMKWGVINSKYSNAAGTFAKRVASAGLKNGTNAARKEAVNAGLDTAASGIFGKTIAKGAKNTISNRNYADKFESQAKEKADKGNQAYLKDRKANKEAYKQGKKDAKEAYKQGKKDAKEARSQARKKLHLIKASKDYKQAKALNKQLFKSALQSNKQTYKTEKRKNLDRLSAATKDLNTVNEVKARMATSSNKIQKINSKAARGETYKRIKAGESIGKASRYSTGLL